MAVERPLTPSEIARRLRGPLPGHAAQMTMATQPRGGNRPDLPSPCPREAAVLILLYERAGQLVLPLTYRTQTVGLHKGQISLPGGGREPQDATIEDTALRETREELGIPEEAVQVLGQLTPLYIPSSSYCVFAVVGYADAPALLDINPYEVAAVFEVPLARLLDPATRQVETRERNGAPWIVPYYRIDEHQVWGATAMILAEFVALLREDAPIAEGEAIPDARGQRRPDG